MQATEKSFDHAFGNDLEPAQLGDLQGIEQVQPSAGGGVVSTLHGERNVSGHEQGSQTVC
jgi:hypothetical protein